MTDYDDLLTQVDYLTDACESDLVNAAERSSPGKLYELVVGLAAAVRQLREEASHRVVARGWEPNRAVGEVLASCEAINSACDGPIVVDRLRKLGWDVVPLASEPSPDLRDRVLGVLDQHTILDVSTAAVQETADALVRVMATEVKAKVAEARTAVPEPLATGTVQGVQDFPGDGVRVAVDVPAKVVHGDHYRYEWLVGQEVGIWPANLAEQVCDAELDREGLEREQDAMTAVAKPSFTQTYRRADGELIGDHGWVTSLASFDDAVYPTELIEETWERTSVRRFWHLPPAVFSCEVEDETGERCEADAEDWWQNPDGKWKQVCAAHRSVVRKEPSDDD